eukprot:CAMPEP_0204353280 /NCGR_PEP_ID=MMETSP0469-20131031/32547_1 /ASSEMBLY_ACC=CAM_ASM_000384 /TAXON_ID=2969 /ORGANISM="Oxyrrhis marina" /LENGTH=46 /DNA_ID= /DNA_START= /DNA_END= /DNA_ORIENTATION=
MGFSGALVEWTAPDFPTTTEAQSFVRAPRAQSATGAQAGFPFVVCG